MPAGASSASANRKAGDACGTIPIKSVQRAAAAPQCLASETFPVTFVSRMRCSAKRCTADPGPPRTETVAMEGHAMTEQAVTFPSAGLKLSGVVHVPRGLKPSERRAAFLVLHGFGSNKTSSNTMQPTKVLSDLGYVVLRFDMRGCGESEGEFGRVICLEQVEDTRNALTFLAQHPAVDPQRIGLIGSSFGGAVAIYTGGVDERVAAVISNGGWGDGERKFRGQHPTPQAWKKFTDMLDKGRGHRAKFGKPLMVPRYDIVP